MDAFYNICSVDAGKTGLRGIQMEGSFLTTILIALRRFLTSCGHCR